MAMAGMAHDGIDSVPQTGTWLLQKGERVTTAETSAKLDKTLSSIQSGNNAQNNTRGDSSVVINQTNNFKQPNNRTANQIAADTSRQQRRAARFA